MRYKKYHRFPFLLLPIMALFTIAASLIKPASWQYHVHDTYFVGDRMHLQVPLGILMMVFWVIYLLTDPLPRSRNLIRIHIYSIVASGCLLWVADSMQSSYHWDSEAILWVGLFLVLFIIAGWAFLFNVMVTIFRLLRNRFRGR